MNWTLIRAWIGTVARLGLAVIWFTAGWSKLHEPAAFVRAVRAYDATPEWLSEAIGYGLPVLEISLAVLLVLGLATRWVAGVSALLLVVFIIGIAQAAIRGIKLECGCFGGGGGSDKTTYTLDFIRDGGILLLAVWLIIFPITMYSIDRIVTKGDAVSAPSAKRMRRDPRALQRFQAVRAARHKEIASQQRYIAGTVAIVIVLVGMIGISVQKSRAKIQGSLVAANASVKDGIVVGKKEAPVTLDVYEDFQCPICEQFESLTHESLQKLVTDGTVRIKYHLMAFLDSQSGDNRYSSRAANAAICASDFTVDMYYAYHNYLFGKDAKGNTIQPAEGSSGRSNAQLEQYFLAAVPKATEDQQATFRTCVEAEQHAALVAAMTEQASKDGVSGTPTVKINGKAWQLPQSTDAVAADLAKAIDEAKAKAGKS